ncbi:MAG: cysteine desulfurase NifS [Armatimonadetes bacterium]|nr:cysteine desulfurase NifS [Armatimonadota bacterium]MDW8121652.1 cysteine desulfurase NifS [Armatimonadota bacterium]
MNGLIYMDYAATTPLDPRVKEAMEPFLSDAFGNPNSIHFYGRQARKAVDESREMIAHILGCRPGEMIFTSGGTESDNLALRGVAGARKHRGRHIVSSTIEHHAVLHTLEALREEGFEVTLVPVDEDGLVDPEQVADAVREDTILVSIMHANNEIGTIQPIAEIAKLVKEKKTDVLVHTDAVQTVGHLPVRVDQLNVDLLSLSAHKFYGPKGVGALYVRQGTRLVPQLTGGGQEKNRRSGTENVAGIVGMAHALRLSTQEMEQENRRLAALRDRLIDGILGQVPDSRLNGHRTQRLAHNANFSFLGVEGEALLLQLDLHGICASSGSACTSGSLDPSHVLLALGLSREWAIGSLRLTLGRSNDDQQVDQVVKIVPQIVQRLRELTPEAVRLGFS